MALANTIPHFRRSHHSEKRSSSSTRKTSGRFHRSLVSRIVTPASEKGMRAGEFAEVGGLPILSAGLGGEAFQQLAILFGVEILRYAVHALKGQYVAAQFLDCAGVGIGALGRDLGQVGARSWERTRRLGTGRDYRAPASSPPAR